MGRSPPAPDALEMSPPAKRSRRSGGGGGGEGGGEGGGPSGKAILPAATTTTATPAPADYTLALVYNVGLADMILSTASSAGVTESDACERLCASFARPKFSNQKKVAEALEASLDASRETPTVVPWPRDDVGMRDGGLPLGFRPRRPATPAAVAAAEYHWHELRGEMMERDAGEDGTSTDADGAAIAEVYFPLLAAVLPEWLRGFAIDETPRPGERRRDATPMRREKSFSELRKAAALAVSAAAKAANLAGTDVSTAVSAAVAEYTAGLRPTPANSPLGNSNAAGIAATAVPVVRRVVFLVSGFGAPRDATHAPDDNSTAATARLMKRFIEASYPNVAVKLVHGGQDAFRYAANVGFVNRTLRPLVERERDAVAKTHGEAWPRRFKLTIALCDGTPARLQALMASFRDMSPFLLHAWQPKRFWHRGVLKPSDVDIQRWERAEATPPMKADEASLVAHFGGGGEGDEVTTTRPTRGEDEEGEENDGAIISRMVDEMKKHRDAYVAAASEKTNELGAFWLRKTRKPVLAVLCVRKKGKTGRGHEFYRGVNLEVSMPTGSLCSERNVIGTALACDPTLRRADLFGVAVLSLKKTGGEGSGSGNAQNGGVINGGVRDGGTAPPTPVPGSSFAGGASRNASYANDLSGLGSGPTCRPVAEDDLNPLHPCGACKEWLYKIAEVNPGFKVVMFTDASCEEVFVKTVGQC